MYTRFPEGFPDPSYWRSAGWTAHSLRRVLLDSCLVDSERGPIIFNAFSTPQELGDPEYGGVRVRVDMNNTSTAWHRAYPDQEEWYLVDVCAADYSTAWLHTFAQRFAAEPSIRMRFAALGNAHATRPVLLGHGALVAVDNGLASGIAELSAHGVETLACCQGRKHFPAYIDIAASSAFPPDLVQAWRGADFRCTPTRVTARTFYGLEELGGERLAQSLADWTAGRLDLSGASYRVTASRPSSLPTWDSSSDRVRRPSVPPRPVL